MKRLFLFLLVAMLSFTANAIGFNFWYDNCWHGWVTSTSDGTGSWNDFKIYYRSEGISNYVIRVTIDNPILPDLKERKRMMKENQWMEFTGTIEYFICDDYPTAYDIWKKRDHGWARGALRGDGFISYVYHDLQWNERPTKRIKKSATIRIAPFKKNIEAYNIWWDNVGLGISFN